MQREQEKGYMKRSAVRLMLLGTVGNMKALFAQKALYSSIPILPPAAFPALPARGGAAGRLTLDFGHLAVLGDKADHGVLDQLTGAMALARNSLEGPSPELDPSRISA